MAEWSLIYDMFWSKFGGHGEWLFVRPEARGSGIVAAIVAQMCADIARAGGEFLRGSPDDAVVARLYGRLAIGGAGQPYYLSASAFRSFGALAACRRAISSAGCPIRRSIMSSKSVLRFEFRLLNRPNAEGPA